jgi:hypothetical protein
MSSQFHFCYLDAGRVAGGNVVVPIFDFQVFAHILLGYSNHPQET